MEQLGTIGAFLGNTTSPVCQEVYDLQPVTHRRLPPSDLFCVAVDPQSCGHLSSSFSENLQCVHYLIAFVLPIIKARRPEICA
ncbi:hypothetical protein TcWFU_001192 [Taenia crassiceps]|uniref:Uncharacterized protein n=1 Tax=Taenia crassiceps TaxID=6207 RepID=A0ABR4Q644_9CEST